MVSLAPGVTTIESEEGLLFVDSGRNRVFAYGGPAAAYLERLCDKTDPMAGLEHSSIPELSATRARWIGDGLLIDDGAAGAVAHSSADKAKGRATDYRNWAAEWTCDFNGVRVRFAEQHPKAVPILRTVFRIFEVAAPAADLSFEVLHPFEFEARLMEDGTEVLRTNDYGIIVGGIAQRLLTRLHPGTEWLAFLHSSAVRLGDRTAALLGPSGSGKSTLAAWLVSRGFDYVSDDLLAVAAPGGLAVPWPMPFSIKKGSWDLIGRAHADLAAQPVYRTKNTEARLLAPPEDAWNAPPSQVGALLFVKFRAGAALSTARLTPFEALSRLLNDRVWLGFPVQEAAVRRLHDWLASIPAVELTYSHIEEAEREVRALLADRD